MRTEELTEWMHDATVVSAPDLTRITGMGRRQRLRGRLVMAGAGVCALAVVATPFVAASQMDQSGRPDYASAPSGPEYRPAEPLDQVWTDLNKLYLSGGSSSVGAMSIWGEASPGEAPSLHYGWKANDGAVSEVGTLVEPEVLADGLQVHVVPSPGADATEPTFVVTYPIARGTNREHYALGVESHDTEGDAIRTRFDVVPGYVVFTFSPVRSGGGVPEVHFVGLTGPDDLEIGRELHHDGGVWTTSPADVATR